jgi:putative acetyltransferase
MTTVATQFPAVVNPSAVGQYSALAGAGGGFVWDEVLEYRVWCHPERGAPDLAYGSDYYYAFASYAEAWG